MGLFFDEKLMKQVFGRKGLFKGFCEAFPASGMSGNWATLLTMGGAIFTNTAVIPVASATGLYMTVNIIRKSIELDIPN